MKQVIYLYAQLPEQIDFVTMGRLSVDNGVGQFVYAPDYQHHWVPDEIHYPLRKAPYTITTNDGIPGFVMDIMPDAWGQAVLKRIYAHNKDSAWTDLDFLIQAQNADRFGNLCVGEIRRVTQKATTENFRPFIHLNEFLDFSDAIRDGEAIQRMQLALAQTTSLGGARPKITLYDQHKLYLAKPKDRDDIVNIPRLEFLCLQFAQQKGLNVAGHSLQTITHRNMPKDVLILDRFDREYDEQSGQFKRYPMMSGLTLLDASWKSIDHSRWSYPLMANEMIRKGLALEDIHELYKRMIFNAMIGNNDDHPKNHAFIYKKGRWHLAPLYDVVPNVEFKPSTLSMQIGKQGNVINKENILSMSEQFLLERQQAEHILQEMRDWREELQQVYKAMLTQHDFEFAKRAMSLF
ncbi:type II toxin-antitoxin system HipA family toxin [Acinetobacter populi]|uniref:Phosphatidylinositol kinase n=1 Tax=Acinetobacter populi TaxID=1582270 RepID=A0A1Z9YXC9_9GAMM|nr:type II toxin-antitoxin system HipA family toxin [Acinetobacter populi]OUY06862.1 phosphatidylinositol kinase [Acinetobacter populi]